MLALTHTWSTRSDCLVQCARIGRATRCSSLLSADKCTSHFSLATSFQQVDPALALHTVSNNYSLRRSLHLPEVPARVPYSRRCFSKNSFLSPFIICPESGMRAARCMHFVDRHWLISRSGTTSSYVPTPVQNLWRILSLSLQWRTLAGLVS